MVTDKVKQELMILLKKYYSSQKISRTLLLTSNYWPVWLVLFLWQTTHMEMEGSNSWITAVERNHAPFKLVPVSCFTLVQKENQATKCPKQQCHLVL